MADFSTDQTYLAYQYGTAEKLRIRQEAHQLYSERPNDFFDWALDRLDLRAGLLVADIGCGPGSYHPPLNARGCRVVGLDASLGMVAEAQAQAVAQQLAVSLVQAKAERLPLATAACDRVLAAHMLYHVPDQVAALREMRRVLKPGGMVLLATNAADTGDVFYRAHCEAAERLGYTVTPRMTSNFHLGHMDLVQSVFPGATVYLYQDAFLFPTVDAALRYYASAMIDGIEDAPAGGGHRGELLAQVAAYLQTIYDQAGVLRVPKDAGCFVARVE
jgi:SAM-dependent methyltransferase